MDESGQIPYWVGNPPRKTLPTPAIREAKGAVRDANDVAKILRPHYEDKAQEFYIAVYLNTKNRVLGVYDVTKGLVDGSLVHPREVFRPAIEHSATSVILAHNHPSGDPTPSPQDDAVHKTMENAGALIGIRLLDSIIIGRDGFYAHSAGGIEPWR